MHQYDLICFTIYYYELLRMLYHLLLRIITNYLWFIRIITNYLWFIRFKNMKYALL
jgi:hypothetical protein